MEGGLDIYSLLIIISVVSGGDASTSSQLIGPFEQKQDCEAQAKNIKDSATAKQDTLLVDTLCVAHDR